MYIISMKKYFKIILLAACLIVLLSAIFAERHRVFSLVPGKTEAVQMNGLEYTETAAVDGLMRKDGNIYDIYSLTPEVLQQKDCPT
ncbi:MAG TPA: hypothetical protein DET40_20205 [Lentisphaeria bacterium]|nr:MAG: hypothetical protein A2X45_16555 [Lentisphaerae bacterium GWF2_50_93]HCE45875.1 hypothetical protein [Lentisphaeria bacterium]